MTDEYVEALQASDRWLGIVGAFAYIGPEGDNYETGFAYACRSDGKIRVIGDERNNYMN